MIVTGERKSGVLRSGNIARSCDLSVPSGNIYDTAVVVVKKVYVPLRCESCGAASRGVLGHWRAFQRLEKWSRWSLVRARMSTIVDPWGSAACF